MSIISKNNNDFNICIIDDDSFSKLLIRDDLIIIYSKLKPQKNNIRLLG